MEPDDILSGRYKVAGLLGAGGMGQVNKAVDNNRDCLVAIKERVIRADESEESREEFEHEAKLLSNLLHPSLPRVIQHFTEAGGQYLVMDFIDGDDLEEALKKQGYKPFTIDEVLRWADKLLDALEYLHSRPEPIIHRDIKPANIKVTREGYVYLLDFGLAKGAAGQMTTLVTGPKSAPGKTPAFAPLEQLNNGGTNGQSDLYSLGATLYRLLTGGLPVLASKRYETVESGLPDPLVPLHQINPLVPFSFSQVISHAMAVSRRQRISSATEMRRALREVKLEVARERARQAEEIRLREEEEQRRRAQEEEEARRAEEERHRQRVETERLELEALFQQREETRRRNADETFRLRKQEETRRRQVEEVNGAAEGNRVESAPAPVPAFEESPQGTVLNEQAAVSIPVKEVSIGKYVAIFAVFYGGLLSLLIIASWLFEWNPRNGRDAIHLGIILGAAISTSLAFYKNQKRFFTKLERFRIICYAFVVVLFIQTGLLLLLIRLSEIEFDATALIIGLSISMFFTLFALIGGFGAWAARIIGRTTAKQSSVPGITHR